MSHPTTTPVPHSALRTPHSRSGATAGRVPSGCSSAAHAPTRRSAFTLLEVILALGLTVIVIGLISMAINNTLKLVDSGQGRTQRDQLARAILSKIAADVRSTLRYQPFDTTGMMSVNVSTSSTGGSTSTTSSTSNTSNNQTSTPSSTSSSSSSSSSSSTDSSSSSTTQTTTLYPGLYGDEYGLQVDVGRLPRYDEYASADSGGSSDTPSSDVSGLSDAKTVTYYLAGGNTPVSSVIAATNNPTPSETGLVRSESDRLAFAFAYQNGQSSPDTNMAVVAPEVLAMEIYYFDGTEWLTSWDTTQGNGLPQAIRVAIALADPSHPERMQSVSSIEDAYNQDPDGVYSQIIRLPASDPIPGGTQGTSSGSSSSSSSSTSNSTTQTPNTTPP